MGNDRTTASAWTGGQYSLYRALLGAYLVVHFAMLLPYAGEVFAAGGTVADARWSPFFGVLPNPLWLGDGVGAVTALLVAGVACGVAVAVGWRDRVAAVLAACVLAWLYQRNPLIANPSLPLVGWLLVLHAFVPSRPYGSLAARRHGADPAWRLPKHLWIAAWIVLALSYSHSGLTKLASPSWVAGDTIRYVLENPLARDHALRGWLLATPPIVLKALTWFVLYVELLFAPLVLSRRLRPWLWGGMALAQVGFLALLNFADLTFPMLLVHLLTFDPRWLRRGEATTPALVLFDGDCAFCHASVRLAWHEDAEARLRFAPLAGPTARARLAGRVLSGRDSMLVLEADNTVHERSRAVAAVLVRLGGLWTVLGWLLRAVPRVLADAVYDAMGGVRLKLAGRADVNACAAWPGAAGRLLP